MKVTFEKAMIFVLLVFWFALLGTVALLLFKFAWEVILSGWHFDAWQQIDFVIFTFGVGSYITFWFLISVLIPWLIYKKLVVKK